jgi:hypothetical protein
MIAANESAMLPNAARPGSFRAASIDVGCVFEDATGRPGKSREMRGRALGQSLVLTVV